MSTATAVEANPAPSGGKKKLILIVAIALVVLLVGAGALLMLMKGKAAQHDDDELADDAPAAQASQRRDPKAVPVFVPLEMFTVNLADRDAERYAQIGITLEVDNAKDGERIKQFMPAIRNNILMAIADRSAAELLGREGKSQLAERVKRETALALGIDMPEEGSTAVRRGAVEQPVRGVHFSNFIIQ